MSKSLQDQLLKAGLVSDKKAKSLKDQKYKSKKQAKKTGQTEVDENKLEIERQRQEKITRDRELNQDKEALALAKAIKAQIHQIIDMNRVTETGDIKYNFSHDKKIKYLMVSATLQQQLSAGRLGIVLDQAEKYAIVPAGVISKINERDKSYVVSLHDRNEQNTPEEDDPYADFEVPDDLMW